VQFHDLAGRVGISSGIGADAVDGDDLNVRRRYAELLEIRGNIRLFHTATELEQANALVLRVRAGKVVNRRQFGPEEPWAGLGGRISSAVRRAAISAGDAAARDGC
jgi:hypothetical protein